MDLLQMVGHLQMPLRNDFASRPQPVPWRVSSNWGSGVRGAANEMRVVMQ